MNYTSPHIHTFRNSQDTGFFNCQDFVGTYTFFASGDPLFTLQKDPWSVVFLGEQKNIPDIKNSWTVTTWL